MSPNKIHSKILQNLSTVKKESELIKEVITRSS